jgi:hypothetical protein
VKQAALGSGEPGKGKAAKIAQPADVLAMLERHGMQLSLDLDGRTILSIDAETFNRFPIRSTECEGLIRRTFRQEHVWFNEYGELREVPISASAMRTVIDTLDARARGLTATRHPVRVAEANGALWIDLGQPGWDTVRISARGWRVLDSRAMPSSCPASKSDTTESTVPFTRPPGMQTLPRPVRDRHALARLRRLMPGLSNADFGAVLFYLLGCLVPRAPYPVLVLYGSEGARKTTMARLLRAICDPNTLDVVALSEKARDGVTVGAQAHVLIYDNVSVLADEVSDQLCLRCEGAASAYRAHYSDRDLAILRSCGPTILTAITGLVSRPDLASRCLFVPLDVPAAGYRTRQEVEREIAAMVPGVLAQLLDALVVALRRLKSGEAGGPVQSRLAGFERLARAAAPALGLTEPEVDAVFAHQERRRREQVTGNNAIALALLDLLGREAGRYDLHRADGRVTWRGSASELLGALNNQNPVGRFEKSWPRDPARLGGELQRLKQTFEKLGLRISEDKARDAREAAANGGRWRTLVISMAADALADVAAGAEVMDGHQGDRVH